MVSSNYKSTFEFEPMGNNIALYYTLENGSLIKKHTLGGLDLDIGNDLVLTDEDKVFIVGSTQSNSGPFENSRGDKDIFVAFWH